jgi:hypothetical protein
MLVACVACHIAVLGYMEDLWRTYIFADFLYLDQLIPHPSSHTLLLLTNRKLALIPDMAFSNLWLCHLVSQMSQQYFKIS